MFDTTNLFDRFLIALIYFNIPVVAFLLFVLLSDKIQGAQGGKKEKNKL
jgi:hypothetical protein